MLGSKYSASYHTNCPPEFKQYEERSCFKLFNDPSAKNTFQQGSAFCQDQHKGKLLTISNTLQYNRTSTYVKLYGNSQSYWVGLMYRNNSAGELVLTDVDGNAVDTSISSMLGLESVKPVMGDCISMTYSGGKLMFMQEKCNKSNNVVCLTEWPGMCN